MPAAVTDFLGPLWPGVVFTAQVTALSALLGAVMAVASGLGRLSKRRLVRNLAGTYIEVFRGSSALVQIFWFFFALPVLGRAIGPPWDDLLRLPALAAGVLALGLNIGSYGGEIVRGAIQAVPRGQTEASVALNMSPTLRMRRIIFPQAAVMMLPPVGNLLIELLKASALVSVIGVSDLTFEGQKLRALFTGRSIEIWTMVLVLYFLMAMLITFGIRFLERRMSIRGRISRQETPLKAA